jgi:excisionase family DNA binding protein
MGTDVQSKESVDRLVKLQEAMMLLSVSRATLYNLMDSGRLAYVKIGKSRRIPLSALQNLILRTTHPQRILRTTHPQE